MRVLTRFLLKHVQKPKDTGLFAWESIDKGGIERVLTRLFGPEQLQTDDDDDDTYGVPFHERQSKKRYTTTKRYIAV